MPIIDPLVNETPPEHGECIICGGYCRYGEAICDACVADELFEEECERSHDEGYGD